MKNTLSFLLVLMIGMVGFSAFADDQSSGCGLGWAVTKKNSLLSSAIRSTTNYILPNSFSMTTGTAGCAKHEIVKNDDAAVIYAVNNFDSLIVEMAEGRGEFLNGFAQALGCDRAAYSDFGSFTQREYPEILQNSNADGIELYQAVRTRMQNSDLAGRCIPQA